MKVITVENLSKVYSVATAQEQGMSFREMLTNQVQSFFKKRQQEESFYALKDVSFEVEQGEVLGIIGKNGSGKSTLLKILSRITAPTSGRAIVRGRVASLLEVGTGFHAELSGRENIFMSGIILGMKRWEINKYFDEIVSFAEVEKFLDVPVKKYSSGMRLRLAFSVAAHLQPEILLIDEVLAVGDYEFEKKCLKVMEGVTQAGRTILFVSHNMDIMMRLCSRVLFLKNGHIVENGSTKKVIGKYLGLVQTVSWEASLKKENLESDFFEIHRLCVENNSLQGKGYIDSKEDIIISITYSIKKQDTNISLLLYFYNERDELLFVAFEALASIVEGKMRNSGKYESKCCIPGNIFKDGMINISVEVDNSGAHGAVVSSKPIITLARILSFEVRTFYKKEMQNIAWKNKGLIFPQLSWDVNLLEDCL